MSAGHRPCFVLNHPLFFKSAIHVTRLTIHEVDVKNLPYLSDKSVEDRMRHNQQMKGDVFHVTVMLQ